MRASNLLRRRILNLNAKPSPQQLLHTAPLARVAGTTSRLAAAANRRSQVLSSAAASATASSSSLRRQHQCGADCALHVRPFTTLEHKHAPGQPNPEYHRHSTRYRETTRQTLNELEKITVNPHYQPKNFGDRWALGFVRWLRKLSDMYFERRLLHRACMLETIAAVPGMVAGMTHHMRSLRGMRHCMWIKPTMDEAENERMHLMTFMKLAEPNFSQRAVILLGQGAFFVSFFSFYLFFPRVAHRFVGYLEEEAVHTYTEMLKDIDAGVIKNVPAPQIAINYWNMPQDATLRDVVLVVRADEADHREVNHHLSNLHHNHKYELPCEEFNLDLEPQIQEQPKLEEHATARVHHKDGSATQPSQK